jgi:hypothetical protein
VVARHSPRQLQCHAVTLALRSRGNTLGARDDEARATI